MLLTDIITESDCVDAYVKEIIEGGASILRNHIYGISKDQFMTWVNHTKEDADDAGHFPHLSSYEACAEDIVKTLNRNHFTPKSLRYAQQAQR